MKKKSKYSFQSFLKPGNWYNCGVKPGAKLLLSIIIVLVFVAVYFYFMYPRSSTGASRTARVLSWIQNPEINKDWSVKAGEYCSGAPYAIPTDGFIGYLWGDSFGPGRSHQGIDIFSGEQPGKTPVVAAYSGYLTRLPEWKSAIIIRIPEDPIQPGRQIWVYYSHMADARGNSFISSEFPPGTYEVFVSTGTLLGYQGNYSGNPARPTGVHLHLSIVLDNGEGYFLNELDIENTLDPSAYFQMNLNANVNTGEVPRCQ